ncbi:ATP-binding protein [Ruminococcaceae bacterium OttesenSCG-928-N02]|nr:ATP-binding protein [Ruminococcaceae bacterium OttesenSCG-928-N02]
MAGKNYISLALDELAALRQNSAATLAQNRATAAAALPTLQALEAHILQTGINAALAGEPSDELVTLEAQKAALLQSAGFPANFLDTPCTCNLCKDTGRVGGELCTCVQTRVRALRRKDVLAHSSLELSSFDGFKLDYYPLAPDAAYNNLVPRTHMADVLAFCKEYATTFTPSAPSLLFMGRAGLGKTHLALAIAGQVLEQGHDVIYVSAQEACSNIEQENFSAGTTHDYLDALLDTQLLVVDDLGTEFLSPYILSELYRIIDSRFTRRRPTIYTTNLGTAGALTARYTEKIASRLLGNCQILHFFGDDIRKLTNM